VQIRAAHVKAEVMSSCVSLGGGVASIHTRARHCARASAHA
jgi:hypothetical protein